MQHLTDAEIKKSFVNASRSEIGRITFPPDLASFEWADHDYLGWTDPKIPQRAYVIVLVDGVPRGLVLRAVPATKAQAMCKWCEDLHETAGVKMFVAKKAGLAGRNGNTLGTLIHGDFDCSGLVRKAPHAVEGGNDDESYVAARVSKLNEHAANFVKRVMGAK